MRLIILFLLGFGCSFGQSYSDEKLIIWEVPEDAVYTPGRHGHGVAVAFADEATKHYNGDTIKWVFSSGNYPNIENEQDSVYAKNLSYTGGYPTNLAYEDYLGNVMNFVGHGGNLSERIIRNDLNMTVFVANCNINGINDRTSYGPGLDFIAYDPCRCQSYSTPRVAAQFKAVRDGRRARFNSDITLWETLYVCKITALRNEFSHPDDSTTIMTRFGKWNERSGYGQIQVDSAIAWTGSIPLSITPFEEIDTFPVISQLTGNEKLHTYSGEVDGGNGEYDISQIAAFTYSVYKDSLNISSNPIGTSFPVSPSVGEEFFNTGNNIKYIYNGSYWSPLQDEICEIHVVNSDINSSLTGATIELDSIFRNDNTSTFQLAGDSIQLSEGEYELRLSFSVTSVGQRPSCGMQTLVGGVERNIQYLPLYIRNDGGHSETGSTYFSNFTLNSPGFISLEGFRIASNVDPVILDPLRTRLMIKRVR